MADSGPGAISSVRDDDTNSDRQWSSSSGRQEKESEGRGGEDAVQGGQREGWA